MVDICPAYYAALSAALHRPNDTKRYESRRRIRSLSTWNKRNIL